MRWSSNHEPANSAGSTAWVKDIPRAILRRPTRFALVWLIPVIAAGIGAWLTIKAIIQTGPTITISFRTAADIEADRTKIKYKNVDVGTVNSVRLSEDLSQVTVKATMVREMAKYLTSDTRFWVVRAQLEVTKLSGLGTLLSGAYISMEPGKSGESKRPLKDWRIRRQSPRAPRAPITSCGPVA